MFIMVGRLSLKVISFLGFEVGNGHSVENNCLSVISRGVETNGKCLSIFQVGDAESQENQSCIAELEVLLILFQPFTVLGYTEIKAKKNQINTASIFELVI